ncbi:hypothetical protein RJ641_016901 [Dillenia turbinata]|uniref:Uncharacterized protein n=1 Tax=Dillenia turbinata TaxID=194707 RepID=A0AAN8YX72_9MAGN
MDSYDVLIFYLLIFDKERLTNGCIGVFHVAHAIDFEGREPEEIVSGRAIRGTLGILGACLNSKSIKRVVYTFIRATVQFINDKGNG